MGSIFGGLVVAAALAGAAPDPDAVHMVQREPTAKGPTTEARTTQRLNAMGEDLLARGLGAPRVGLFDVAWPNSTAEYDAVGRNGILQVTVVVADRSELPLRSAYVHTDAGDTPLLLIGVRGSAVPEASPIHGVGAFREDCYYLLPVALVRQPGFILVDFAQHRSGFKLSVLPLEPPGYPGAASAARPPEQRAVRAFLKREFVEAPETGGQP
jgi:hypothetical protein